MDIPGFGAEQSLYASKIHYSTLGGVARPEGDVFPTFLGTPLEMSAASVSLDSRQKYGGTFSDGESPYLHEVLKLSTNQAVIPMGVPAHHSFPASSGPCNLCTFGCDTGGVACALAVLTGCLPLLSIPFAGEALAFACTVAGWIGCAVLDVACRGSCFNIGSACCPVACGRSCCNSDETCSDTGQGLCCSPGTTPCGTTCCQGKEVCTNGVCCLPGSTGCGGTCCDNTCGQCVGGTCIPVRDGTACPIGSCCGGACVSLVSNSDNCGACGKKCPPNAPFCIGGFCSAGE